jgi:hypothetical protein
MNTLERAGALIALVVFAFGIGKGWDSLNNRIDKVDEKIGAIQKTLGSTSCNAILTRQLAAIDKNKPSVRKELDDLSKRYGCGPHDALIVVPDFGQGNAALTNAASYDTQLDAQLNEVDFQLNRKN